MQPISVNITVEARHIPSLVCADYASSASKDGYDAVVARAVADALGIQDFLFRPDRLHELRRWLWEHNGSVPVSLAVRAGD